MRCKPELGQALFGNPHGKYDCPEYVCALFDYILGEISRVYWNNNQKAWDYYDDPQIPGIEYRSYCWDSDSEDAQKPNFKFKDVEIRWYKYPGRGMSINVNWSEPQTRRWFDECIAAIRNCEEEL